MPIHWTRFVIAAVAVALSAGWNSPAAQQKPGPFTSEVEEFVKTYIREGGDKLTDWVQGETAPDAETTRRAFKPLAGLTVELVASEPAIRQPVDLHFDDRGRLWVVQYLQYPFPAGLNITSYDQYLRARYNGVPAAPPNHVRGADKITVLEDKDGDGTFESYQDVITGLNITTSVLTGRGGVWVMNPPYLLFYRDATGDGLPEGDPEVRLAGFGLEDTHSLANSLTWGPDGWLYGVHGSTSTGRVRGISFLGQAVWRYHPERDAFELFAEGGGNPWTLSFDSKGRAFSGDNGGNSRGFHWVQGGRYEKNWPKHGPFTRPHSYGFISNMDHQGDAARFAMTGVVYEDGKLPGYEGQLISGMALTSRIQATRFVADGATFRTVDTETLVTTADRSFRPVDMAVGPDGGIYIADWCDIRMDHTDPRDTWDKSCGRIWRLRTAEYKPVAPFNLARHSGEALVQLLGDTRKWYRDHARRLLGERRDRSVLQRLEGLARNGRGQRALEALWAIQQIGGLGNGAVSELLSHPDAPVRAWTMRLIDAGAPIAPLQQKLIAVARTEPDAEVRSELANLAGRLDTNAALAVLHELIRRQEDLADKHVPLRIWWSLERKITADADAVLSWLEKADLWQAPLFTGHIAGRIARRLAADRGNTHAFRRIDPDKDWKEYASHPRSRMPGGKGDYTDWETNDTPEISGKNLTRLARLLEMAPAASHRDQLLAGMKAGLEQGPAPQQTPVRLSSVIGRWWAEPTQTADLVDVAARLGHPEAVQKARTLAATRAAGSMEGERTAGAATVERGRLAFLTYCAPCHQTDGSGMARLAAPLRNSKWVLGPEELLIRIVLNGVKGDLLMPAMGTLDDQQLAAVLTYIRRAWGHEAGPVSAERVARVRAASAGRTAPWTRTELLAIGVPE
jgi:putative membrane-bound dehydrogenase-like protein